MRSPPSPARQPHSQAKPAARARALGRRGGIESRGGAGRNPGSTQVQPGFALVLTVVSAAFVVALGYGATLPLLPTIIADVIETPTAAEIARHTALLTAVFALAPLLTAYPWGRLSDRVGRRPILCVGLVGFALSFVATAVHGGLPALYIERFLAGAFAAAVVPSVLALITDVERDDSRRARAFGWVSVASSLGLLGGPVIGGLFSGSQPRSIWMVFAGIGLFALVAAVSVFLTVPRRHGIAEPAGRQPIKTSARSVQFPLIALAAIAAGGLAVFEVGLTLKSQALKIEAWTLGLMFAGCMVVMLIVQAAVFSPLVKPIATRWLIAPAFLVLGGGLAVIAAANGQQMLLIATTSVAASGGLLGPVLAFWLARAAPGRAGTLGLQSALVSVGQTLGSAGAIWLVGDLGASMFLLVAFGISAAIVALSLTFRLNAVSSGNP